MFIAIIGTRYSGKSTVEDYLVHLKGFTCIRLSSDGDDASQSAQSSNWEPSEPPSTSSTPALSNASSSQTSLQEALARTTSQSFLSMTPPLSSAPSFELPTPTVPPLAFSSASRMLSYVTQNWRTDFVTVDLNTKELLEGFSRRPFFMVVSVDAPLLCRFRRSRNANLSLEEFVEENDQLVYGQGQTPKTGEAPNFSSLDSLRHSVNLHILNAFDTVAALHAHLEEINVVNPERVRPHWDTYFMTLASLASHRSNCMKRRVGAILVRNHRIVATGYNGTPRGVKNCKDGGCPRCNSGAKEADECLCLHAEENALLEAGRERVGEGSVLYCNTCPCLKCTIKIIQTGVKEVVYNLTYKVDDASARLFNEAGVQLRRHAPPS